MTKPYKCRVEYLESSGTQYIDTGVIAKTGLTVEARIKYISNTGIFCGAITTTAGNGDRYYAINFSQSNKVAFTYLDSAFSASTNLTAGNIYTIKTVLGATKQEMFVNGVSSGSTSKTDNVNLNWTLGLFGLHRGGTFNPEWYSLCSATVYYVKIWDNKNLVRDFIPVLDNSGRPAMYDQVSEKLFYNQGSGDDFSYGRQIIPVEYLESTGTQYIDTGFKGKNNLHYKTKVNFTTLSTSSSNGIGGEYLANASAYIGMVRANGHYTYLFNNTAVETTTTIYANTDYEIDSVMNSGSQVLKVNGETISTGTLSGTFTSTRNIFLYAVCSTNDAADVYGSLKMYYCQIYDNDVLVRDFIPCIDENLTPFMFDKVNCTVYLNAGTGQFKVGPNVEKVWGGKKLRRKLALALANLKKKRKYYCEVEYLESTGTQYINLNYIPTDTTGYKMGQVIPISNSRDNIIIGCRQATSSDSRFWQDIDWSSANKTIGWGFGGYSPSGQRYSIVGKAGNYVVTSLNYMNDRAGKVDDITYDTSLESKTLPEISRPMYLFAGNNGGNTVYYVSTKIYFVQITEGNKIVRDFIPVLDWNYVPCMYDRVTEQLFYNQGTGNFTAGRQIHQVEYLESTGTQYIDLGVGVKENTVFKATFSIASTATGRSYFGARNSSNERFQIVNSIGIGGGYYLVNSVYPIANQKYEIEMHASGEMYLDGVKRNATNGTFSQVAFERNLWLFATNYYDSSVPPGASTFWKAQIFEGDTLVRDLIPAIDENGVGFMFDKVSHTCFLNRGTGAFKYPAREVEYLESDGARAIIAGVTVDDTCGYDVKWMAFNANDTIILGTKGSGDSRWVLSGNNNPNVNISWNTSSGGVGLGLNKIQTAQMNYFNDRKRILNDTPLTDITQTLSANASTYSVGIFGGYWGASSISLYSTCRIYYAKISKGSDVIRDYIAAFKDGSPCLFDKVEQLAYFGTGTGTFTTGKIVEPEYE